MLKRWASTGILIVFALPSPAACEGADLQVSDGIEAIRALSQDPQLSKYFEVAPENDAKDGLDPPFIHWMTRAFSAMTADDKERAASLVNRDDATLSNEWLKFADGIYCAFVFRSTPEVFSEAKTQLEAGAAKLKESQVLSEEDTIEALKAIDSTLEDISQCETAGQAVAQELP